MVMECETVLFLSVLTVQGVMLCEWGTYGSYCNLTCPLNCQTNEVRHLRHCHQETGRCSEGCIAGWYGDMCNTHCHQNCRNGVCNRRNGQCFLGCKDNHTYYGDFCNVTKQQAPPDGHTGEKTGSDLASILVPVVFIIAVAAAVVVAVIMVISGHEEMTLLRSPGKGGDTKEVDDSPDTVNVLRRVPSDNAGIMSPDAVDREIAKITDVFVEASSYKKVKDILEQHGHVTMSGAAGGGKTSIALMLGSHYQQRGFQLVVVVDVCNFKLSDYTDLGKGVCLIFRDVFRRLDFSRDLCQFRDVLRELWRHLHGSRKGSDTGEEPRRKVYAIFTTNMDYVETGISQLEELEDIFFKGPSFLDVTDLRLTAEEKKGIFLQHCKNIKIQLNMICQYEQSILGFPQACKLFVEFPNFQKYSERFFQAPFRYLREELLEILRGLDDKAAAFVVMFLYDGDLNLHQVERKSDNTMLESIFTTIEDVVQISSRTAVAMAVRQFRGTFFTNGDRTGFSHRSIYNACACALFDVNPSFALKHCRTQFIHEHVQGQQGDTTLVNKYEPRVYLSDVYTDVLEVRLSELDERESSRAGRSSKGVCNSGVLSQDVLDNELAETKKHFIQTSIYQKVQEELEKHGHVAMSGAAGGGKTSIALMLGSHYQQMGFLLIFVVDICKFNLSDYIHRGMNVCFIFRDIFRTLHVSKQPVIKNFLVELHQYFVNFPALPDRKRRTPSLKKKQETVYAIFTSNSPGVTSGIAQLEEQESYFFKGSSVVDFTNTSHCQYTREDKRNIFMNHCKHDQTSLNVESVCSYGDSSLGFPQTCKLFFGYPNFQQHGEEFYQTPFFYLREELLSIIRQMNGQSAAFILMFMCSDKLNLRELETSENPVIEDLLMTVNSVVQVKSRTAVAMSIRMFRGTFFTKGDITGFSHPTIYDGCANALFDFNPSFALECCHIQFLRDHVQVCQGDNTKVDPYSPSIILSHVYAEAHASRLATK
ncbi:uncharacterized protein [Haliotis asinina]|uniref:uncharacterized protein n=1 Tax=Haliotis asinina TaxID=109174 RepID=UPI0035321A4F